MGGKQVRYRWPITVRVLVEVVAVVVVVIIVVVAVMHYPDVVVGLIVLVVDVVVVVVVSAAQIYSLHQSWPDLRFSFLINFAANINKLFEAMCCFEYANKNRSCRLYMCTMSNSVVVHANTACQEYISAEVTIIQS